jgi:hypothetical protein
MVSMPQEWLQRQKAKVARKWRFCHDQVFPLRLSLCWWGSLREELKDTIEDWEAYDEEQTRDFSHSPLNSQTIHLLKAQKGGGKTSVICNMLQRLPCNAKVLALSTQQAVAAKFSTDYNLTTYLDISSKVKKDLHKESRLVISPQSLFQLFKSGDRNKWPKFDVLVLDEANAILKTLSTRDMHQVDLFKTILYFNWLVASATDIILADADLSTWHLDVVKNMITEGDKKYAAWLGLWPTPKIKINYNKHMQDKVQYFIVRPDEMKLTFFNIFWGLLERNPCNRSPVACMVNTKTDTYMFLNLAIEVKLHLKDCLKEVMWCGVWIREGAMLPTVVMVNGNTSAMPEMQKVLVNPNVQLVECEAFIVNSVISTIDIQLLHFKFMFAMQGQGQAADWRLYPTPPTNSTQKPCLDWPHWGS